MSPTASPKKITASASKERTSTARAVKALEEMNILFGDYPLTELNYKTPFELLMAVMLSAQTTDKQVNKVTKAFFEVAKTPEDVVRLGESGVKEYIKTVGLHVSKTKNLVKMSQQLIERGGEIPDTLEEMTKLAGVGIKTAKVVLYVLYGKKFVAVDTHVQRVMYRLGIVQTTSPEQTSHLLEKIIPDSYKDMAHRVVIYFGRYLCKAQKPECYRCPLTDMCVWYREYILSKDTWTKEKSGMKKKKIQKKI